MILRKMDGCEIMDLDRFMEIVETEEYEVKEIKPFLDFLFNCNYNELCDYLVSFDNYSDKLVIFMNTLFKTMNSEDKYYDWFIQSLMYEISDEEILELYHYNPSLLWNVIKIIDDGRIAFVDYTEYMVSECKNYFDILNILDKYEVFSEANEYILDNVIYNIKNLDFIDFGEYRNSKK